PVRRSAARVVQPLVFVQSSGDPPHPHSFPTRRSSDLQHRLHLFGDGHLHPDPLGQGEHRGRAPHALGHHVHLGQDVGKRPSRHPDRKSTRLNSSHGSISYAVFCLKKKTQPTSELLSNL